MCAMACRKYVMSFHELARIDYRLRKPSDGDLDIHPFLSKY